MEFTVKGEQASVGVEVLRRPHPNAQDSRDLNWISTHIELSIPGYRASFNADLQTFDIAEFLNQVQRMYNTLSGQAVLSTIEKAIYLQGKMTKTGQITWKGKTIYPIGLGATLEFEFTSDQSYLPALIAELEAILKEYPVI